MDIITLGQQKGGSTKTTCCLNLAVEAERVGDGPVVLVDLDPQGSLSKWWNRREATTPGLVEVDLDSLSSQFAALKEAGTKLVIVDTPGTINSLVRKAIQGSDLVVIPSRASIFDVETLFAFCDLV